MRRVNIPTWVKTLDTKMGNTDYCLVTYQVLTPMSALKVGELG